MIAPIRINAKLMLMIRNGDKRTSNFPAMNDPTIHMSELGVTAKPAIELLSPGSPESNQAGKLHTRSKNRSSSNHQVLSNECPVTEKPHGNQRVLSQSFPANEHD